MPSQKEYAVIIRYLQTGNPTQMAEGHQRAWLSMVSTAQNMNRQYDLMHLNAKKMNAEHDRWNQAIGKTHDNWSRLHMGISATRIMLLWIGREGVQALSNFGRQAFEVANQIQIMEISMKHFLGSTAEVGKNMAYLKREAVVSPFGLVQVMGLGASLTSAAPYFRQQQNLERAIKVMEDIAVSRSVISGGEFTPEESMQTLNRNMVRFFVTNDKQGQYLGQLSRMFPIIPWKQLKGESQGNPEKMISLLEGFVGAKGWTGMSKEFEPTWSAQYSNLRDSILLAMEEGIRGGRDKLVQSMMEGVGRIDWSKPLGGLPAELGAVMGDFLGWFSDFAKAGGLHDFGTLIGNVAGGLSKVMKPALESLAAVAKPLAESGLLKSLFDVAAAGLSDVASVLKGLEPILRPFMTGLAAGMDAVTWATGGSLDKNSAMVRKLAEQSGRTNEEVAQMLKQAQTDINPGGVSRVGMGGKTANMGAGVYNQMYQSWVSKPWYGTPPVGTDTGTGGGKTTTIHVHGGINVKAVNPADFSKQLESELGDAGGGF